MLKVLVFSVFRTDLPPYTVLMAVFYLRILSSLQLYHPEINPLLTNHKKQFRRSSNIIGLYRVNVKHPNVSRTYTPEARALQYIDEFFLYWFANGWVSWRQI